jgi:hypothetical protein
MPDIRSEPTPNPNSIKFTADGATFADGVHAFSSADEAGDHPLARRLFALPGVDDVFLTPQFVTVSKQPSAEWAQLTPKVENVLSDHLEQ